MRGSPEYRLIQIPGSKEAALRDEVTWRVAYGAGCMPSLLIKYMICTFPRLLFVKVGPAFLLRSLRSRLIPLRAEVDPHDEPRRRHSLFRAEAGSHDVPLLARSRRPTYDVCGPVTRGVAVRNLGISYISY